MRSDIALARRQVADISARPEATTGTSPSTQLRRVRLMLAEGLAAAADHRERTEWLSLARDIDQFMKISNQRVAAMSEYNRMSEHSRDSEYTKKPAAERRAENRPDTWVPRSAEHDRPAAANTKSKRVKNTVPPPVLGENLNA